MQRVSLAGGWHDATGNSKGAGSQGYDSSTDCQVNWSNAVIDMAYRRGDNDRPEVLGHGFIEVITWKQGMSREAMKQPEALWLADALDDEFTQGRISNHNGRKAAVELRRLHERCEQWRDIHDAVVADSDKVYALLRRKREWVGLTDEERHSIREWQEIQKELGPVWAPMMLYLYLAIEAKLKEKNT